MICKTESVNQALTILVTGGAGYIGSHCIEALIQSVDFNQCRIVVVDNLSTGHQEFLDYFGERVLFEKGDLLDHLFLNQVFERYRPAIVLHFAAKISVAESVANPELYFKNNVDGSKNLLNAMKNSGCNKIVFSSTAAVYGAVNSQSPLDENTELKPINPYGQSKLLIENELQKASEQWALSAIIFRYFNASGASHSGMLGEWHEPETHLIPLMLMSVMNENTELKVFGSDYKTRDGTCIRDYVHVSDLASAHLLAVQKLINEEHVFFDVYNLGTESGSTVLEVIQAAEKVCNKKINFRYFDRRPGDSDILVASGKKAKAFLGWKPRFSSIDQIISSAHLWHKSK